MEIINKEEIFKIYFTNTIRNINNDYVRSDHNKLCDFNTSFFLNCNGNGLSSNFYTICMEYLNYLQNIFNMNKKLDKNLYEDTLLNFKILGKFVYDFLHNCDIISLLITKINMLKNIDGKYFSNHIQNIKDNLPHEYDTIINSMLIFDLIEPIKEINIEYGNVKDFTDEKVYETLENLIFGDHITFFYMKNRIREIIKQYTPTICDKYYDMCENFCQRVGKIFVAFFAVNFFTIEQMSDNMSSNFYELCLIKLSILEIYDKGNINIIRLEGFLRQNEIYKIESSRIRKLNI